MTGVDATPDTIAAADCVLILTNHSVFDGAVIADRAKLVVDTRNALKAHRRGRTSIVTL
jgi:UDP-N-acetyl-D-glucosamine dehydrogenase